VFLILVKRIR